MAKFLVLRPDGAYQQVSTIDESDGAADADGIPSLNADGVLDPSLLNAATTGTEVVVLTGPDGRLDPAIMPTGVGADTATILSSEALSAGNLVNIFDSGGGATKVRRADAGAGRPADGFVLEAYAQATKQDQHSVLVDYDVFVKVTKLDGKDLATVQRLYKAADLDFRLKPGSAAVDRGVALPNVTDGFAGQAPDLGALEVGQPLPTYGPRNQ